MRAGVLLISLWLTATPAVRCEPFVPASDSQVLAELPAGLRHRAAPESRLAASRWDVAALMAKFYITRARTTGDLRYLGYAEGTLAPWLNQTPPHPELLVLQATVLQSRHEFSLALTQLDRALQLLPDDPQAWLTRATVLRVLGRYDEARVSCEHLAARADAAVTTLCEQSLQSLSGHLQEAYDIVQALPPLVMPEERAWQCSELGEMAERLGEDARAEQWFRTGLKAAPDDFYLRSALADLLLRQHRAQETVELLTGYESFEPMLLRLTLAHQMLQDGQVSTGRSLLADAFEVETRRGEAVHRREQARYLLDLQNDPAAALTAAEANWSVQREPDDALILLRCAQAAHQPEAAADAVQFLRQHGLEDVRLNQVRGS
jgi:predicted Zn-dependent protease